MSKTQPVDSDQKFLDPAAICRLIRRSPSEALGIIAFASKHPDRVNYLDEERAGWMANTRPIGRPWEEIKRHSGMTTIDTVQRTLLDDMLPAFAVSEAGTASPCQPRLEWPISWRQQCRQVWPGSQLHRRQPKELLLISSMNLSVPVYLVWYEVGCRSREDPHYPRQAVVVPTPYIAIR